MHTDANKWIAPLGVVLLVIVALGIWAFSTENGTGAGGAATSTAPRTYANETYGISFTYPDAYALREGEFGNGERALYVITLEQKQDLPPPENGEGPPAIEIALYQNNLDRQTALAWVQNDSRSNWKLGNETYATTSIDGAEAVVYRWSGLYEGITAAFAHKNRIVAASVGYLTPADRIIADYEALLTSMRLD